MSACFLLCAKYNKTMAKLGRPPKKDKLVHLQGYVKRQTKDFAIAKQRLDKLTIGKILDEALLLLQNKQISDMEKDEEVI